MWVVRWRIQSITRQLNKCNKLNGLKAPAIVMTIRGQLAANRNSGSGAWKFPISVSITGGAAIALGLQQTPYSSSREDLLTEHMNYDFLA